MPDASSLRVKGHAIAWCYLTPGHTRTERTHRAFILLNARRIFDRGPFRSLDHAMSVLARCAEIATRHGDTPKTTGGRVSGRTRSLSHPFWRCTTCEAAPQIGPGPRRLDFGHANRRSILKPSHWTGSCNRWHSFAAIVLARGRKCGLPIHEAHRVTLC